MKTTVARRTLPARERDVQITMEHLCGATYAALAGKWGICHQRVYQIVHRMLSLARVKNHHDEAQKRALVFRLSQRVYPERDTPEAFYNEVYDEKWGDRRW